MNVLVTGADGFLGANLCAALLADGHDVVGAALNRKGRTSLDALGVDIRMEYGDVLDRDYLRRLVNAHEPRWVFHLAAVSIVRIAEADPYRCVATNVMGALNALDACRYGPVAALVVASSDKAYGDYGGVACTEDMELRPKGTYELSKALADVLAQGYARHLETRVVVTRCANLYGPGDLNWSRLVPNSCRRIWRGAPPQVHPGAWQYRREWLHVWDAVRAYMLLAELGSKGEAYNVGSGQTVTAGYVAKHLADLAGVRTPVESNVHVREIPAQSLCSDRVHTLGWRPLVGLEHGLGDTLAWYRDYLGAAHA